ncbi:MAG TPA: protein kinase [Acidimicrobiales bacterium]|nr:protein kinase [Acidimicrobiales bacterium]
MSKIFLSYRRDDTAGYAGRLYDRLLTKFGTASIFRDIDSIQPGVDFVAAIDEAVRSCDAFIAVIGKNWLTATDPSGNRRLDNPDDYVRNEIAAALRANLLFIPVLVERAPFPTRSELPAAVQRLTRYNAIELSDDRWNYDMERLIARLQTALSDRDHSALHVPELEAASILRKGSRWTLYRARRAGTSRAVTVKVLTVSDLSGEAKERFERECQAIAKLSWHPTLATVHQWGITDDGYPFMVMEDLDGASLDDRLRRGGPLPWQEVATIGIRLADALDAAHGAGVLHGDMNPSKVLVGPVNEPLLADFALARLENEVGAVSSGMVNSVAHAAPEVLTSGEYSIASDVYSLGSTLHALLTGKPPFMRQDEAGFIAMVARASTQPVSDLRPLGVPDSVCSVIERAMAKTAHDRWPSARELGQALSAAQQTEMGVSTATTEQPTGSARVAPAPSPATTPVPPAEAPPSPRSNRPEREAGHEDGRGPDTRPTPEVSVPAATSPSRRRRPRSRTRHAEKSVGPATTEQPTRSSPPSPPPPAPTASAPPEARPSPRRNRPVREKVEEAEPQSAPEPDTRRGPEVIVPPQVSPSPPPIPPSVTERAERTQAQILEDEPVIGTQGPAPVSIQDSPPSPGLPRSGELLNARYEPVAVIDEEATGVVWRAHDVRSDRDIALKELRPAAGDDPAEARERLMKEARAAARLSHPNVVAIHDVFSEGERVFIAMELLEGPSLAQVVRSGPQPAGVVRTVMTQVAEAVAAAHAAGIVGLDLEPNNIFWIGESRAVVTAFGRVTTGEGTNGGGLPGATTTDVFAWAAVAYQLASGQAPFAGPTTSDPSAGDDRVVDGEPSPLWLPDDPALAALIAAGLSKDPTRRPADGKALTAALVADASPPPLRTEAPPARVASPSWTPSRSAPGAPATPDDRPGRRRGRLVVALSAAAVVVVILAAGLIATRPDEAPTPTPEPPAPTVDPATAPLPNEPGPLGSGSYVSSRFRPAVQLTLADGWRLAHQKENNIALQPSDDPGEAVRIVSISRVTHVFSSDRVYTGEEALAATAAEPAPENLVGWFQAHKRLSVSPPRAVTVGGRPAEVLEVTVKAGYRTNACTDPSTSSCVVVFPVDGDVFFWLRAHSSYHMYFVRVGAEWVVITLEAPTDVFASFREQATPVIDSVRVL